jgi:nucleoside-diphosphate-sugar epimerase
MGVNEQEDQAMTSPLTRLLVVGGSGFFGRHIVNHAVGLGWDVTNLSLTLRQGVKEDLPGVRHVAADVANGVALKEALGDSSFKYVVNCGGYIDHTLFSGGGRNVIDAHFLGVLNLVPILNRNELQAFINIGSSDEYGKTPAPQIELQREAPISPYSLGKVAATHFLQMLHRTESFPATTLRLFLTYGPGQEKRRFLPQIILGCLEGRSFPTSRGEQLRDFCFIQDTVNAVFRALAMPAAKGEVMNIASGQAVSIRQIIETVRRLIGRGEPRFGEIAYRPGESMELYANVSKAKAILGWAPEVTLEIGLNKTIQWIRGQS